MQTNETKTPVLATLTDDLRHAIRRCLIEAIEEDLHGDHGHYLSVLDSLPRNAAITADDDIFDAIQYFDIDIDN